MAKLRAAFSLAITEADVRALVAKLLSECELAEDFAWLEGIVSASEMQAAAKWNR